MKNGRTTAVAAALAAVWIGLTATAAQSTEGQPVLAGRSNTATNQTYLTAQGNQGGLYVIASGGRGVSGVGYGTHGVGVHGYSYDTDGVVGQGKINGVKGVSASSFASGVYGENSSTGYGVAGRSKSVAVFGDSTGENGIGVLGNNYSKNGIGLYGAANDSAGLGVYATNPAGVGLSVNGRAKFSSSGRITIPAGQLQGTVSATLGAESMVLATLQQRSPGITVEAAVPNAAGSALTVYLNKAVPVATVVAWFVVN